MNADDLAKLLDQLGQRLGPTGEHVFNLAVRQVFIEGTFWGIFGGVCLALTIGLPFVGRHYYNAAVARSADDTSIYRSINKPDHDTYAMLWGAISLVFAFLAVLALYSALPAILNPEYVAIRDLLGAIR